MSTAWRWARTRSIGTSHIKAHLTCQDHVACMVVPEGDRFIAVVSDGAGTAPRAADGSRLVCAGFLASASHHLRTRGDIASITEDEVFGWLDDIRERINAFAKRAGVTPRACAATLVGMIAGAEEALVIHVGDGAAVVRDSASGQWQVASWPAHGEYASTTYFVTDDPAPLLRIVPLRMRLDRIALFSDGIERMVLDHANKTAHAPFFERMTAPVAASDAASGHDRGLSALLCGYLGSDAVNARTDDDKSLILGARA